MKKRSLFVITLLAGVALEQAARAARPPQAGGPPVRPIGVVTQIQPGQLTLHTDAGPDLIVHLPDGVSVLRVSPGAKNLKSASKIAVSDISPGDRVIIMGPVSADQKSVLAKSVIVMTKTALAEAREAERIEWQRRGIGGVVKAIDLATKEITIAVPNAPPTPGNPTHPVTVSLNPNAKLLRYAPDSVRFSDAKPSTFGAIKIGDQVLALGDKSAGGARFTAEELVSGTFRNIGATVISVDATHDAVTVKDLATGKPLLVRTNADSQLHRLPPFLAYMIVRFNSGGGAGNGAPGRPAGGVSGETPRGEGHRGPSRSGGRERRMGGGGPGGALQDFQHMLERTPPLLLGELKPGEPLIVVSTAGADSAEVTAIAVLAGVEPILRAQPKGSNEVQLGPWNMSMDSGGEGP